MMVGKPLSNNYTSFDKTVLFFIVISWVTLHCHGLNVCRYAGYEIIDNLSQLFFNHLGDLKNVHIIIYIYIDTYIYIYHHAPGGNGNNVVRISLESTERKSNSSLKLDYLKDLSVRNYQLSVAPAYFQN